MSGYEILRSTDGSSYSGLTAVSPRSVSYSDSTVQGLGATYWYKVEALSDQRLCREQLSVREHPGHMPVRRSRTRRSESGGHVQEADGGGKDGDGSDIDLGVDLDDVYGAYRAVVAGLVSSIE